MKSVSLYSIATTIVIVLLSSNTHVVSGFVAPRTTTTTSTLTNKHKVTSTSTRSPQQQPQTVTNLHLDPYYYTTTLDNTSSLLTSFTDQGQNLAGIFFQASLLPYLAFLYFMNFKGNRTPALGNFGLQFLLLFVLSTIPSGIITKSVYDGATLADTDWLHGIAESLLTVTNLLVVFGFRQAMFEEASPQQLERGINLNVPKLAAFAVFAAWAVSAFAFPSLLGTQEHSQFLFGVGNLSDDVVQSLSFVKHIEPVNALSIPTWAIHFSSVFEYIFAIDTIWKFSQVTGNQKWKGLSWGMLPLHASGIAACTHHFFYNVDQLIVDYQAGLTLLGNLTCAYAAFRLARSNGWELGDMNILASAEVKEQRALVLETQAATPYNLLPSTGFADSKPFLIAKLVALTVASSYAMKYGSLALDVPFNYNPFVGTAIVLLPPAILAYNLNSRDAVVGDSENKVMSFADIKKYGTAGVIAYVVTELLFWAVAFPVASVALYNTSGHWPDVFNNPDDRATVLGFIFAGANIARLAVPLRLAAAVALIPTIDKFIDKKDDDDSNTIDVSAN